MGKNLKFVLGFVAAFSGSIAIVSASPNSSSGGMSGTTKLKYQIEALKELQKKWDKSATMHQIQDSEGVSAIELLSREIAAKEKELKILTLKDEIERAEFLLKNNKILHQIRDLSDESKTGVERLQEEIAAKKVVLEQLVTESAKK